jgi:hypothetical protein
MTSFEEWKEYIFLPNYNNLIMEEICQLSYISHINQFYKAITNCSRIHDK